jgi:hypothetical protein
MNFYTAGVLKIHNASGVKIYNATRRYYVRTPNDGVPNDRMPNDGMPNSA